MQPSPPADEHDAGRFERDEIAITAGLRDPTLGISERGPGTDSRGDEHDLIGREQLDVNAAARAEIASARAHDRAFCRRLEAGASPD